jgi:glycosyltransferase involved in cell wall biosynthesis
MHSSVVPAISHPAARKPRLLFVSSRYLFPADSGGKIRTVGILRGLTGGAFEVHLASPLPKPPAAPDARELGKVCDRFTGWSAPNRGAMFRWTRMRHIASRLPIAVATDYSEAGHRTVTEVLRTKPDLLVVDFPHAAVIAPPPYSYPSVLFTHNVEAEIFRRHADAARDPVRRAVWRNQATKMERYERALLSRFSAVVAVADRDRDYFRGTYGIDNVSVIPTGVDLDYFSYSPTPVLQTDEGGTVVFTGSMDWLANIDAIEYFMDEVWPDIARARPGAKFVIVGRNPPFGLVDRARARKLNWTFTGFVDDVRPYVRDAHVYVIPLRVGGGTRIKVYEAMAIGCPVVSTRIGVEGLPVEHQRHFVRADGAKEMANAVIALLDDSETRLHVSRQARNHVELHMAAESAAQVFEDICKHVIRKRELDR